MTVFVRKSKLVDVTETLLETKSIIFQYNFWKKSKMCTSSNGIHKIYGRYLFPGP